jgi:hypothetical protein
MHVRPTALGGDGRKWPCSFCDEGRRWLLHHPRDGRRRRGRRRRVQRSAAAVRGVAAAAAAAAVAAVACALFASTRGSATGVTVPEECVIIKTALDAEVSCTISIPEPCSGLWTITAILADQLAERT